MLQTKDTTIVSEINDFFTSSEKAIRTILTLLSSLTLSENRLEIESQCNSIYQNKSKLSLLLLFPFFDVKDPSSYDASVLYPIMRCGKDAFYRLANDFTVNWRKIAYNITMQLMRKTDKNSESSEHTKPRCLIIDDTDLPKTGKRIELIGKVFSHVTHQSVLAFKGLFMGLHDGKSFFALDFSLHGEKGKNKKRPYGMTKKQLKNRYSKQRDKASAGKQRKEEYFATKIQSMISMIRTAIKKGIRFDYLLVDSWFTCFELVKFITTRRIGCHLLGMAKMGKTRYLFQGKNLTAKEIVDRLRRSKKQKRSKLLGFYYAEATVDFKGVAVRLLFCKTSRRGRWNVMLTTNLDLDFEKAYKIYSTRWSVEVFFKESKQHLGLGKCQSQDFDAQIAHSTICMIQYNLLSVAKRFAEYETIGALFRNTKADTIQLTVTERIWKIIIELLMDIAEMIEINVDLLIEKLIADNEKLIKLTNYKNLLQAG